MEQIDITDVGPLVSDAFLRLESIFQAEESSPEAGEMEVLVTLIEAYEEKRYPAG